MNVGLLVISMNCPQKLWVRYKNTFHTIKVLPFRISIIIVQILQKKELFERLGSLIDDVKKNPESKIIHYTRKMKLAKKYKIVGFSAASLAVLGFAGLAIFAISGNDLPIVASVLITLGTEALGIFSTITTIMSFLFFGASRYHAGPRPYSDIEKDIKELRIEDWEFFINQLKPTPMCKRLLSSLRSKPESKANFPSRAI